MIQSRRKIVALAIVLACAGCKTEQLIPSAPVMPTAPLIAVSASGNQRTAPDSTVTRVSFEEPLPPPVVSAAPVDSAILGDVLTREWLAAEVEARNPSLEAMFSAWQAAAQLYPQRIALEDPILMGMIAPQSAASELTETAYALQLNQKLPWLGKRRLRGAAAAAEADAAFQEAQDTRLQIRLAADQAFFDYYLARQLVDLNRDNLTLMRQFRESALVKYRTNLLAQQDVLQADLELADLERRQLELTRMLRVAIARINTLLRRWPDAPLPPPENVATPAPPDDASLLWQTALQQRPDLAALAWRVQSAEAELELAYKQYYPDLDAFGRYDTFWQPASTQGPLRAQLGVAVNLPVYCRKLQAAVCEAQFRLSQRRAEFDQKTLEIQYEVVAAAEQVEESRQAAKLYAERLIPAAEQNVAAARANYEVNKLSFIELAQSQRQRVAIYERQAEALVAYHRRLAELQRAVASPDIVGTVPMR